MRRWHSKFSSLAAFTAALLSEDARAQSCCAGGSAVTPGRLGLQEHALVGVQLRAAAVLGSYGPRSAYAASPSGASEQNLEQDLFAAVRFLRRGQFALLVPLLESRRVTPTLGELGGGLGDANVAARYDALYSHQYRYVPGIALLAGATLPTGVAPEAAKKPLVTDATGIGVVQLHAGLALEKRFTWVVVNLTGLVAKRLTRSVGGVSETLGTRWTALAACTYIFSSDAAIALAGSYFADGNATSDGVEEPSTGRRLLTFTVSGAAPLSERVRIHASLFLTPPASSLGQNQLATAGGSLATLFTWL